MRGGLFFSHQVYDLKTPSETSLVSCEDERFYVWERALGEAEDGTAGLEGDPVHGRERVFQDGIGLCRCRRDACVAYVCRYLCYVHPHTQQRPRCRLQQVMEREVGGLLGGTDARVMKVTKALDVG